MDSTPGVPLKALGRENKDVIEQYGDLLANAVVERLRLLAEDKIPESAAELVQQGFCDPVRLFVKQEPHTLEKVKAKRYRLISSVSLLDQLVERVLCGVQNRAEIMNWSNIPSKPGLGLDDVGIELIYRAVTQFAKIAQSDISAWDWSMKGWQFEDEARIRADLAGDPQDGLFRRLLRNRFKCLACSVFAFSDGQLVEQLVDGVMDSGSYNTSSTNSRQRIQLAYIVGAEKAIAMGDDCVETPVSDAVEKYGRYGFRVKEYTVAPGKEFVFCSHRFVNSKCAEPQQWSRTLYRLLCQREITPEFLVQFRYEMRHCPVLNECLELLSRVDTSPEKSVDESTDA